MNDSRAKGQSIRPGRQHRQYLSLGTGHCEGPVDGITDEPGSTGTASEVRVNVSCLMPAPSAMVVSAANSSCTMPPRMSPQLVRPSQYINGAACELPGVILMPDIHAAANSDATAPRPEIIALMSEPFAAV